MLVFSSETRVRTISLDGESFQSDRETQVSGADGLLFNNPSFLASGILRRPGDRNLV